MSPFDEDQFSLTIYPSSMASEPMYFVAPTNSKTRRHQDTILGGIALAKIDKNHYHYVQMPKKKKSHRLKTFIEFLKVQIAGNVLFWVTYLSYFVYDEPCERIPYPVSFIMATVTGNIVFFLVDQALDIQRAQWQAQVVARSYAVRIIFMTLNFFLNLFTHRSRAQ
jgi:uncharacterized membrane protein